MRASTASLSVRRCGYQGIFAGLEDLGHDLLCETADGIEVSSRMSSGRVKTTAVDGQAAGSELPQLA